MKLSDRIIRLRKAQGWSQEEFADKLYVSRQAVSRWENGTALPDAQNILQISKLFHVTTDYLLHEDYESDGDIPVVQTAVKETEVLFVKKKRLHLFAAICFTVSAFCSLMGVVFSNSEVQLALSCCTLALCTGVAIAQFVLYFKKR